MNATVLGKAMKLEDDNGGFIWQRNLKEGPPVMLAGRPYDISQSMDNDAVDGNKPLMLGDFREGYRIVRRKDVWILRDPFSSSPNVVFKWYARYGGKVAQSEAIKILEIT